MLRLTAALATVATIAFTASAQGTSLPGRASVSFFRFPNCNTTADGPPAVTAFEPGQCQVSTDSTGKPFSYTISCSGGNAGTSVLCASNDCKTNCRSQQFTSGQCTGVQQGAPGSAQSVIYSCPAGQPVQAAPSPTQAPSSGAISNAMASVSAMVALLAAVRVM